MVRARDVLFIENFGNYQHPVNNGTNVPLHQVSSQESSDEVQGDMVDMVEEGESQHTEIYEDHSSSENVCDSDLDERRYPLRERTPEDFSNFKLYHTISDSSFNHLKSIEAILLQHIKETPKLAKAEKERVCTGAEVITSQDALAEFKEKSLAKPSKKRGER
ncbi:hypothetical protein JTB14_032219 [Gonioctena quinquepunctata]|nr:hypothetical protein JTB14_032219 [Gonioctena quinquepunctata]